MTSYQAHREGVRKLREWEDNDFDRERYESYRAGEEAKPVVAS